MERALETMLLIILCMVAVLVGMMLFMKLAQFVSSSGTQISINPQHVVTVRPSGEGDNKSTVFLVTGGQITVEGNVDEVTTKLAGDS